jgi:hypothetical protein
MTKLPLMIGTPERACMETKAEINGHTFKRQRVDASVGFTSEEGCTEMRTRLREFQGVTATCTRTHVYSINVNRM